MERLEVDAVLFDMDGTLIDTTRSYSEAILGTAQRVLNHTVSPEEITEIRRVPGFNNDWDVTWTLIRRHTTGAIEPVTSRIRETDDYLRMKDAFQTFYLGDRLWSAVSGHEAPFVWSQPLIERETLLIREETLAWLADHVALGIATARPRIEAEIALRQHALDRFFTLDYLVAVEDAPAEKPDPAPLHELIHRLGCTRPVYVGDTVNDIMAAQAAGIPSVFVGPPELLTSEVTPTLQLRGPDSLPDVLSPRALECTR
jgi:HAD superfamily phosphatase